MKGAEGRGDGQGSCWGFKGGTLAAALLQWHWTASRRDAAQRVDLKDLTALMLTHNARCHSCEASCVQRTCKYPISSWVLMPAEIM